MSSTALPPLLPDEAELPEGVLLEAARLFAQRRLFGLAWLDRDLVARARYGAMVDFVPLGERVTDSVAPLIGLDEDLANLQIHPEKSFRMPNVAMVDRDGASPKLNVALYWQPERESYVMLVSKVGSSSELELGLAQQVRMRLIAEEQLARQSRDLAIANAELTRANRDLAEFANIISHDLKAPLRAMRYFADDLERALGDPAAGDPLQHAANVRAQARRMSHMLNDLLAYSRVGRREEAVTAVDTASLVQAIVDSLPRPPGLKVALAGTWPVVDTCAAPLDLVLRNLIGNAIAHHDRDNGEVVVFCCAEAGALEIEVRDDGPGIPTEWHEAVFQPFRTMSDRGNGDSSGIGLALVRRTAESVGAEVQLVSDPAMRRGTIFKIRWPLVLKS